MPSYVAVPEAGESGQFVRCSYCDTTWLARHCADDAFPPGPRALASRTRRPPPIIEGEIVRPVRFAAAPASGAGAAGRVGLAGRFGFAAGATALILMLIAVVLLTPTVSARPHPGAASTVPDGLSLVGVTSRSVMMRGGEAVLVEGEIVNRTGRDADVPAVRIALTEQGSEVYAWVVEPTVERFGAGSSVGFRSAMAAPRPGLSHFTARLSTREAPTGKGR